MGIDLSVTTDQRIKLGAATAASLWVAGAIGIAVAFNRHEIAIVLALVTYLKLQFIPFFKAPVGHD